MAEQHTHEEIANTLGRIEATQVSTNGWLRAINAKLDKHLDMPHADADDVRANTRWRWMLSGLVALVGAISLLLAALK